MASGETDREIARLLRAQDQVISREQVVGAGGSPADIARRLRRREWVRVLDGVYVAHTGRLTRRQRAWVGVLRYAPAALGGHDAVRAVVGEEWRHGRDLTRITLVVSEDRHPKPVAGYRFRRIADLDSRVQWHTSPPRLRLEHAILDLAAAASTELAAIGLLADACQGGGTTADRLLTALRLRRRIARKHWLTEVLTDLARGTCSVLERGYLTRVERAHGLPAAQWQRLDSGPDGMVRRDADYAPYRLIVELNGRLFHDDADHYDQDLERDLGALVDSGGTGRLTARLGWGQVFERPCRTAGSVGLLLQRLGWPGAPSTCPDCLAEAA